MDTLSLSTSQLCCLISLLLAATECACFYWIKHFINHNPLNDTIFEQLEHFFNELKPIYIISYVTLYGLLLLAARYWVYLFIMIISIQTISLLCNSAIIFHFIKKKNNR